MNALRAELQELPFYKMEGCGNSFVLISHDDPNLSWSEIAKKVCDVHFGIGSDGLLNVVPAKTADFEMRMYNPDGSPGAMCGNGVRCAARYVRLTERVSADTQDVSFDVWGRVVTSSRAGQGQTVCVDMGAPIFEPSMVPINAVGPVIDQPLFRTDGEFRGTVLSMGNPHCVLFVDSLESVDVARLGSKLEKDSMFPDRANIEFTKKISDDLLEVRVWERGAGITYACGSGACAAVVAGCASGICAEHMKVRMPGGLLDVKWDRDKGTVYLTGPATVVCTGVLDRSFLNFE